MGTLLQVLTNHPGLVMDHAQAYAGLLASETQTAVKQLRRQAILTVVAIASLCVGAVLVGVAWMLFALGTPLWALVSAPLPALLVGGVCLQMARQPLPGAPFADLKRQWAADIAMFQENPAP
jgi:hypothetical protein